jgi:ribosomal protein S18 acetylase RimI-like enzyme
LPPATQEFRIARQIVFISLEVPHSHPLDNPIWNALNSEHAALALGGELAKRYPPEIGPLSGMTSQSAESYEELRALAGHGGLVGLFLADLPAPPPGWTIFRDGLMTQMICPDADIPEQQPLPNVTTRRLTSADAPAMLELAKLTEPGPFRQRTSELGVFWGVFHSGRLLAMAGQRLHLPQFVEISAVCTHPDARGRGYARALMCLAMQEIRRRGKIPFLHAFADNYPAIRVYEGLGFIERRTLNLAILRNDA